MSLGLPASRGRLRVSGTLLGALWLTVPVSAQATDPQDQLALRDVVRAAYIRAGQPKTDAEIANLAISAQPFVTFDPRAATEADIVGLVGRLGLTDASLPKPPDPVALTRTLSSDPLPDYGGVDLTGRTAVDLAGMLQRGETTSREIVLQYMYKIQQLDHAGPALRSVEQINPDILMLADRADAQRMEAQRQGRTLPPLFGVPVLLKMNIGTADDLRTTAGSAALIGSRPAAEAPLVSGMLEQGLLILGKANMGQWAGLSSNNQSSTGGQTISPVDPSIAVAGSSSGPSIAAAMRFAPLTVGSQTSDSIIYPAQQQGLYALKPTAGLISTTGIAPYSRQIDTAGPMGNSVHDLALALNGMVKRDATDTRSKDFVRPASYDAGLTGDLTGLKVGIYSATPTEDPQRPAQFDSLVGGMLTAAHADVMRLDRAGVDAAVKTAVLAMSDDDLAQFVKLADASAPIPTDPAARATFLSDYRQTFTDGSRRVEAATNGATPFYFYDAYVSISGYLASRVSSPDDYKSALVRLLGDKFSRLNLDPKVFARTIDDLVAFARKNPGLDSGEMALAGLAVDKVGPFASIDDFSRAYANWIRISTALMSNVRTTLGVDAVIGFLGTDDDTNDGLGLFSFSTEQTSTSPQLNVPFQVGGTPANILIDANPYQEQTLLRIGQALQQQLGSDAFRQYQAVAPNPPATGYGDDQPDDSGPLLPLVLKNLDDHGRATKAHLLTTEMAPLVLDVTGATGTPHFDGRISGNGGLIKDGAGIQLLIGTSDFTGGVFVWQGGLAVDKSAALGAASNTVTLENKSALIATRSFTLGRPVILRDGGALGVLADATLTEDAVVSGNGGLFKTGRGRLSLLADNTYTGGTHIRAGTVSVSREANLGQAYGAVTIGDGAALEATASFTTTRPFTLEGVSALAVDPAQTLTVSNVVSGPGMLFKLGTGTLTLGGTNSFSGGVLLAAGTLSVARDANLGASSGPIAFDGGTLRITGTTFATTARPIIWGPAGGGLDIADPANTVTLAQALSGSGGLTKAGPGTLTLAGTNTYTGATTLAEGTLLARGGQAIGDLSAVTVAASATLALADSETVGSLAGQGRVALGVARLTAGGDGTSTTFAGTLDGAGSLTKAGAGTLTLTGASTYTGGTSIAAGTLQLGDGGTSGSLVGDVANAGTLAFNRADDLTYPGTVSGAGSLMKLGDGTLTLTAGHSFTGPATLAAGGLNLTATASLAAPVLTRSGTALVNAGTLAGGLTNAGTALNTGAIIGGVANLGNLTTIGTIAGGLTNVGSLTNGGTITGAVANTGTLTTSGTLVGSLANAGQAANSGTVTGSVGNTGSLVNSGAIAGGVANAGTLMSLGAIAGGLTNTGSVTASAGRIDGAIRNDAGTLAVTGAVASNGTFANAAGATLAVSGAGAYSLNGPLTNTGTVTIAQTASLTAPAGLSNAGLIASDGILTTDLTNTGTARLSGQLNGALTNTGSLLFTGTLAGLTSLTNAGPLDLNGSALTLANLTGPASGVIGNGALTVTGSASTTYAGTILEGTAPTSLTKAGSGTLNLTATGRFSGPTTIQAGTLSLNGFWTSPVTVAAAGTLRGIGTIAAPVTVAGALRPGNSPGTLTVSGPVALASGSLFGLDIDGTGTGTGAGSYARLLALGPTGAVAANGTLVPVLRGITGNAGNTFTPALGQRFGVLTAQAGLTGAFTGLAQPGVGLSAGTRFDALYRATGLDLVVTPSAYGSLAGLGLAQTGNAQAVGAALDRARPAAGTWPDADRARVFDALYAAAPATLPGGLASLSGQAYGDAVIADLAARRLVIDTIDRHLRGQSGGAASLSAGDPGLGPNRSALQVHGAAGAPDQTLATGEGRVWADALYGFGARTGDRAAAGADLDAGGLLLGVDRQVGSDTLVGGVFSYLRETGTAKGQGFGLGRTTADSYGGTLYASTRLGAVILRGTAGLSYADGRIDRTVALGAGVSRANGLVSGWDAGVSGFAGTALATGLPVELVPELGFSVDRLTRARVAERGGLASQSFATAGLDGARSLVGGRLASLAVDGTAGLQLEGRAYWAHELGETFATVRSSLFGVPFASRTSWLGRDGAVLGVSLTGPVAEGVMLSLSYTGDMRPGASTQVVSTGVQARW